MNFKQFDESRHTARRAAIIAKRVKAHRYIRTYYTAMDVGTVSPDGVYQGGFGDCYRLGDISRRHVRAVMCNTSELSRYARRNRLNAAIELRMEGY